MESHEILSSLQDLARSLDLELRWEQGDFEGGLCRISDRQVVVLNKNHTSEKHVAVLSRALSHFDTSASFLVPEIRRRLGQARTQQKRNLQL